MEDGLLKWLLPNTMRMSDSAGDALASAIRKDYGGASGRGRSMMDLDADLDADEGSGDEYEDMDSEAADSEASGDSE